MTDKLPVRVWVCPTCGRIETALPEAPDVTRTCLVHKTPTGTQDLIELLPRLDLTDLRDRITKADDWWYPDHPVTALLLSVHNVRVKMGTFQEPLCDPITREPYEPELMGLTLAGWQWVQAQRQTLAVLDFLIGGKDAS